MGTEFDYGRPERLAGVLAASNYLHGYSSQAPAQEQSLSAFQSNWQAKFQTTHDTLAGEAERTRQINDQTAKQLENQRQEFAAQITKEKAEWTALHKVYDESLALAKPVDYWKAKATTHRRLAWAWGVVSFLAAGVVFSLLYQLIQIALRVPQGIKDPATWHPEYWRIGALLAAGVFGVWFVRILVLLFLSHVHLLADANERVTMANTYLALLRSEGGLQPKDRELILAVLFHPAATGVVKDEGVPLSWLEAFTKLKGG